MKKEKGSFEIHFGRQRFPDFCQEPKALDYPDEDEFSRRAQHKKIRIVPLILYEQLKLSTIELNTVVDIHIHN